MGYLYLAIAIVAEVAGTVALKASAEFTNLAPSTVVVVGYAIYPAAAPQFLSIRKAATDHA